MIKIVSNMDKEVAQWMSQSLGCAEFQQPYVAFGLISPDNRHAGVLFNDYYPGGNIEITFAGEFTVSRHLIRMMHYHVFESLGCSRVTAKTPRSNKKAAKALERLGFKFEVIQKCYFGPEKKDDALVYVAFPSSFDRILKRKVN